MVLIFNLISKRMKYSSVLIIKLLNGLYLEFSSANQDKRINQCGHLFIFRFLLTVVDNGRKGFGKSCRWRCSIFFIFFKFKLKIKKVISYFLFVFNFRSERILFYNWEKWFFFAVGSHGYNNYRFYFSIDNKQNWYKTIDNRQCY